MVQVKFNTISRNPAIQKMYEQDPLVYSQKMSAKTIHSILSLPKRLKSKLKGLH